MRLLTGCQVLYILAPCRLQQLLAKHLLQPNIHDDVMLLRALQLAKTHSSFLPLSIKRWLIEARRVAS